MQAIMTKYLPPTNTKGARIKAQCASGASIILSYPTIARDQESAHQFVAMELARKLDWLDSETAWFGGSLPADGYCFVRVTMRYLREVTRHIRLVREESVA